MTDSEKRYTYTGILGTIAFHLIVLVIFLAFKMGSVKTEHKEVLMIEFAEQDYKPIEEILEEENKEAEPIEQLSEQTLSNIVSNTAEKMDEKISTEKYIEEVMKDLGMEEINQQLDNSLPDEVTVPSDSKKEKKEENSYNFGKTRITYNVPNRKGRYIERPIYRCQGGGEVVVSIWVDQSGFVAEAHVKSSSTSDECIHQMALESAKNSSFNSDYNAPKKVEGTISYVFVAQ